jgi:hypothetical protein
MPHEFGHWNTLNGSEQSYILNNQNQGFDLTEGWIDETTDPFEVMKQGEIGWNTGTLQGAGSILGGLGSLAQAWAGLQGVKLGKERLAMQDQQFGANFTNQATLLNNQVDKHNTWAAANRNSTTYNNIGTDYKNIG